MNNWIIVALVLFGIVLFSCKTPTVTKISEEQTEQTSTDSFEIVEFWLLDIVDEKKLDTCADTSFWTIGLGSRGLTINCRPLEDLKRMLYVNFLEKIEIAEATKEKNYFYNFQLPFQTIANLEELSPIILEKYGISLTKRKERRKIEEKE